MERTLVQKDLLTLRQNLSLVHGLQQDLLLEVIPRLSGLHGWDQSDRERATAFIRDTATIFRFFKRADQCQSKTIEALQAHLLWRRESRPETIDFGCLDKCYADLFSFMPEECCDRLDRPVAVLRLNKVRRSDNGSLEDLKQFVIWSFECARRYLRDLQLDEQSPCLTFTILVDLEGASKSNIELEILPFLLDIGRNQYPGLCSNVFVLRFGWWWASAWTILKRLLPASTLAKITFPSEKELFQVYFERSSLPPEFNGTYISTHDNSYNEVQLRYRCPEFPLAVILHESSSLKSDRQPNCSMSQHHRRSSSFFEPETGTESIPRSSDRSADGCLVEMPTIIPNFSSNIELTLPKFHLSDGSETPRVLSTPSSLFPATYGSAESLSSEHSSRSQAFSATRRRATISEISTVLTSNLFAIDPYVARVYARDITTHHLEALEPIAPADEFPASVFVSGSEQPDDLVLDSADSRSIASYISCQSGSLSPVVFPVCTEISAQTRSPYEVAPRDRSSRDIFRTLIFLIMLKTRNIRTRLALLLGFSHLATCTPSPPRHGSTSFCTSSHENYPCLEAKSQLSDSQMIVRRQPSGLSSSEIKALVLASVVFVLREIYKNFIPNIVVNGLGGSVSAGAGIHMEDAWGILGKLVGLSG